MSFDRIPIMLDNRMGLSQLKMFRATRTLGAHFRHTHSTITAQNVRANSQLHKQEVINAINGQLNKRQPFKTFVQISGIILGTVSAYAIYQTAYRGSTTFIPFYISKAKREPYPNEVDAKLVQLTAQEQILERLSLDPIIQQEYKLPINISDPVSFDIWVEDKDVSVKGVQIAPKKPYISTVNKPIRPQWTTIMEPIGGEKQFEVPVLNNRDREYDVWFLGHINLIGKNGKESEIVYKGTFDFEHIKQAKIKKAHLIRIADGKKKRVVLWDK